MLNSALRRWNLRLQPARVIAACGISHIGWSQIVGSCPWHFATCSLHFTQQLIGFLLQLVGLGLCAPPVAETGWWQGSSPSLRWVLQGELGIGDFKEADPLLTVQIMRSHFDFLVLSCHFL